MIISLKLSSPIERPGCHIPWEVSQAQKNQGDCSLTAVVTSLNKGDALRDAMLSDFIIVQIFLDKLKCHHNVTDNSISREHCDMCTPLLAETLLCGAQLPYHLHFIQQDVEVQKG